jgi:hypothetical protein
MIRDQKVSRVYFVRSDIRELQQNRTWEQHAKVIGNTAVRVVWPNGESSMSAHKVTKIR